MMMTTGGLDTVTLSIYIDINNLNWCDKKALAENQQSEMSWIISAI